MRIGGIVARSAAWALSAFLLAATLATPGSPLMLLPTSAATQTLMISGSITGLVPGATGALVLTVHNNGAEAALVRALDARISESPAGCPASALSLGTWRGRLVVPAQGSATATLPVVLASGASDCAGATWRLAYTSH